MDPVSLLAAVVICSIFLTIGVPSSFFVPGRFGAFQFVFARALVPAAAGYLMAMLTRDREALGVLCLIGFILCFVIAIAVSDLSLSLFARSLRHLPELVLIALGATLQRDAHGTAHPRRQ